MAQVSVPILPGFAGLHFDALTITDTSITLSAHVASMTATCPNCGNTSARVHSTYDRHPRDLPWRGVPVRLTLRVRRFLCSTSSCRKRTFVEQVPGLTRTYAQRTVALNAALLTLGCSLGGEAAARLGQDLGVAGRAATILRRVHQFIPLAAPPPWVVGVDEWAIRKGHHYGSVVVDVERQRPIALLPEHTPAALATWFQQHPSIEIIARDRASIYAEALAPGAPQAQQVADRWHLMQHLGTALQDMLIHHTRALRQVARQLTERQYPPVAPEAPVKLLLPDLPGHIVGPPELRQFQFAEAKRLRSAGWSLQRIARELHLNRRTVRKYVQAAAVPRRVLPQATSRVQPYLAVVQEHWARGIGRGLQWLAILQTAGYRGRLSSVYRALKAFPRTEGRRHAQERVRVRSPRQAMWLLVRATEELSAEDQAYRDELCVQEPLIAQAAMLGQRFLQMVRNRQGNELDAWLGDAEASGIKEHQRFAQGLRRDANMVQAALTMNWNNGQTEGHVNRLEMIKRTMFGRASFNLLRNRVLDTSTHKRDHGS